VRIAIDGRKLHDFGIGTYVRNLVRELARLDHDDEYVVLCPDTDAEFIRALGPRFSVSVERAGNYSLREQFSVPLALRRARVDLFHAPHYVVSPLVRTPFVVTIHDCIHLRFPQYLPGRGAARYAWTMMRSSARRSRRILTVSEASREDIVELLHIPAGKIEVIHNAIDEQLVALATGEDVARVRERYQLHAPFVMYTGNIKPHKNIDRLIEAFSLLRERQGTDVKLVIIGDEISKYPNLRRLVHRHKLDKHVRFLGFVPDATLAGLYRLAALFVFPSLYEGFGLPPLEAMALGTPVVVSNVSSLPEVVGDAAVLIDPHSAEAIASGMHRVLNDAALRADLVGRGYERVKAFSWARSVARTRQVYAEVVAEGLRA
jgi:glycosyltransferase involved in cell wall biosynthesis